MNTIRALLVACSVIGLEVIGQADVSTGISAFGPLLKDIGIVGVLVWYLWYQSSVQDPKRETRAMEAAQASEERLVKLGARFAQQGEAFTQALLEITRNCEMVRAVQRTQNEETQQ